MGYCPCSLIFPSLVYFDLFSVSKFWSAYARCMTIRQRILMYRAFFCHECFALFWFDPVFATCTSPIMHLICPPKFCITFVFHFSWVLQPFREKLKTRLTQNFGRHIRPALWEMCKWRIQDICQLCTRFDGIKAMSRGLLGGQTSVKICQYA